jgi:hypothetical protein
MSERPPIDDFRDLFLVETGIHAAAPEFELCYASDS